MCPGSRPHDLNNPRRSPNVHRVARERRAARSRDRAAGPRRPPPLTQTKMFERAARCSSEVGVDVACAGWAEKTFELRSGNQPAKVWQVAGSEAERPKTTGVRLILENSTVCHSRRISLLCPVFLCLWM